MIKTWQTIAKVARILTLTDVLGMRVHKTGTIVSTCSQIKSRFAEKPRLTAFLSHETKALDAQFEPHSRRPD